MFTSGVLSELCLCTVGHCRTLHRTTTNKLFLCNSPPFISCNTSLYSRVCKIPFDLQLSFQPLWPLIHQLAPVVERADSTLHWINHYPRDHSIDFDSSYNQWINHSIQHLNNRVQKTFCSINRNGMTFCWRAQTRPQHCNYNPLLFLHCN